MDVVTREKITRAYRTHLPYLVDLAFRMVADIGVAEDIAQDAFSRLISADLGEIEDERGWLIVVTSRLCLDRIKSAAARREHVHDAGEIESITPPAMADPADRITLDDTVRLALLVMLRRLSPAERVVFVLHDVFGMPFEAVARAVGRTTPACRQIATRARHKIAAGGGTRFEVASAEHRVVTERFIAACSTGDLAGLLAVLAQDAWGEVDLGPRLIRPRVLGAERVARNLLRFWGRATLVSHPIDGRPTVLGFVGRQLTGVLVFTLRAELIQAVRVIGDPDTLGFLERQLLDPHTTHQHGATR